MVLIVSNSHSLPLNYDQINNFNNKNSVMDGHKGIYAKSDNEVNECNENNEKAIQEIELIDPREPRPIVPHREINSVLPIASRCPIKVSTAIGLLGIAIFITSAGTLLAYINSEDSRPTFASAGGLLTGMALTAATFGRRYALRHWNLQSIEEASPNLQQRRLHQIVIS